jgi:hypothetical protein
MERKENDSVETVAFEDKSTSSHSDIILTEEAHKFRQINEIKKLKENSCFYKYFCCKNSNNVLDDCFWFYYWRITVLKSICEHF